MKPVLEVRDIWKKFRIHHERSAMLKEAFINTILRRNSYEEFWALKGVSFSVNPGEMLGIIGENGAGKSTILRIISQVLEPDRGSVVRRGRVSALIELTAGFHPDLTGRENIYLNGAIYGMSKREVDKKFDEIVDFSGLERFIDTPVKHYSSGMYMRLGFAVAISVDFDILLVDEVLAVGDENFQQKCMDKIQEIKSNGAAILLVSHSLETVRNVCERGMLVHRGIILEEGKPESAIQEYLDKSAEGARA